MRSAAITSLTGTTQPCHAAATSATDIAPNSSRHAETARSGAHGTAGRTTRTRAHSPSASARSRCSAPASPGSTNPPEHRRTQRVWVPQCADLRSTARSSKDSPVSTATSPSVRRCTVTSHRVSVVVMAAVIAQAADSVRPKCGTPGSPTSARPRTRRPGAEKHTGWYGPDSSTTRWGSAAINGAPDTERSAGTSHALEPEPRGVSASSTGPHSSPSVVRTRCRHTCSGSEPDSRCASRCTARGVHGCHGRGSRSANPSSSASGHSAHADPIEPLTPSA